MTKFKLKKILLALGIFGVGIFHSSILCAQVDPEVKVMKDLTVIGAVTSSQSFVTYSKFSVSSVGALTESFVLEGGNFLQTATNPTEAGSLPDGGGTQLDGIVASAVQGHYLYTGTSTETAFTIIDISDPTNPTQVGSVIDATNISSPREIEISGKYAYVANQTGDNITVIDISNPNNPLVVGTLFDNAGLALDRVYALEVVGKYAYVTSRIDTAFVVLDISDPLNPFQVGVLRDSASTLLANPRFLAIQGSYAYVADSTEDGLQIIDISDPTNPTPTGNLADSGATLLNEAQDLYVSGKYAYVLAANVETGLTIIDVSNPKSPSVVSTFTDNASTLLNSAGYIQVVGKYAYISNIGGGEDGIQILNVEDPSNPYHVGNILDTGSTLLGDVASFSVVGKYIYSVTGGTEDGISILDISGIEAPAAVLGTLQSDQFDVSEKAVVQQNVNIRGGFNVGTGGIHTDGNISSSLSIADNVFLNDVVISYNSTSDAVLDVSASGVSENLLRIRNATLSDVIRVRSSGSVGINMNNPTYPLHVTGDTTVSGNLTARAIFLASGTSVVNGTFVSEWTDNGSSLTPTDSGRNVTLDGNLSVQTNLSVNNAMFVRDKLSIGTTNSLTESFTLEGGNFRQIPDNFTLTALSGLDWGGAFDGTGVHVQGDYAYAGSDGGGPGFQIIDISDPTNATALGSLFVGAADIEVAGKYAYSIHDGQNVLRIIDISSPNNPIEVGATQGMGANTREIYVSGNYAYIGTFPNANEEFYVIGISDPTNPKVIGALEIGGVVVSGLWVRGDYAYLGDNGGNFRVIDVSDPENPAQVGIYSPVDAAGDVHVAGNYAFWGDKIVDISDPKNPTPVGDLTIDTTSISVFPQGNYLYLGITINAGTELRVYDISDPSSPSLLTGLELGIDVVDLFVSGKYLFVTVDNSGGNEFRIYDIAGMDAPSASIEAIETSQLVNSGDAFMNNSMFVGSGMNVGQSGIHTSGAISSSLTIADNTFMNDVRIGTTLTMTNPAVLDITASGVSENLLRVRNITTTDAIYVRSSGSVGISNTSPIYPLHISGDTSISSSVTAEAFFLADGTLVVAQVGTSEWSDDGTTLTTTDANRDVTLDGNLSVQTNLSVNNNVQVQDKISLGANNPLTETFTFENGKFLQTSTMTPVEVDGEEYGANGVEDIWVQGNYLYMTAQISGSNNEFAIYDFSNINDLSEVSSQFAPSGALHVAGKYAYFSGLGGLVIYDISNPSSPYSVGSYAITLIDLYVSGNYAYLGRATGSGDEFRIIDISDPYNPYEVSSLSIGAQINEVYVQGKYAYIAVFSGAANTFRIIDVSDPTNPVEKGAYMSASPAQSMFVAGNYAYYSGAGGLDIVDISNPNNPTIAAQHNPETLYSIYVAGDYAYCGFDTHAGEEFRILDVSAPTNPIYVAGFEISGRPEDIFVSGKYAFIATNGRAGNELIMLDISGITSPGANIGSTSVGQLNIVENAIIQDNLYIQSGLNVGVRGIHTDGEISTSLSVGLSHFVNDLQVGTALTLPGANAVLDVTASGVSENLLRVRNISTSDAIRVRSSGSVGLSNNNPIYPLHVTGDVTVSSSLTAEAFFVNGTALSVPATAVWDDDGSILTTATNGADATIDGNLSVQTNLSVDDALFVTSKVSIGTNNALTESFTLEFGNYLHTAGTPELLGGTALGTTPNDGVIIGNYVYIATDDNAGDNDVDIIDISNPSSPTVVGGMDLGASVKEIDAAGKYIYIQPTGSFQIWDVSNPTNPHLEGSLTLTGEQARGIDIVGNYAYVGTSGEFRVIDISDPSNPKQMSSLALSGAPIVNNLIVQGRYAYLHTTTPELEIIDIKDPENPFSISTTALNATFGNLYISGRYLYTSVFTNGGDEIEIFDVSNPKSPSLVGGAEAGTSARNIVVVGDYAYVGTSTAANGIQIYNVSDATSPYLVASAATSDSAEVMVSGKYLYAFSNTAGNEFEVFDISGIDTPAATIGSVRTNSTNVLDNMYIGNKLYVYNGFNVGFGGFHTDGEFISSLSIGNNVIVGDVSIGTSGAPSAVVDVTSSGTEAVLRVRNLTTTDAIYVNHKGNVGINTTSPTSTLDVDGALQIPNSNAPSVNNDGDIAFEIDEDAWNFQAGSAGTGGIPANTDVMLPLLEQKDMTLMEPDYLEQNLTDSLPFFTVDSYNYPSGVTITAFRVITSANSTDTYNLEQWDDPRINTATRLDIASVSTSASDEETTLDNWQNQVVPAGSYVFVDLDDSQDDIEWAKLSVWYFANE